jgi:tRNA(Ile2)-agmatinylcytidine synthase
VYIGIDDTDSLQGMCTTYLVKLLISHFSEEGIDLIGYPRLVRLNPNVPWKTRGNGAVSIRVGRGKGKKFKIGEIEGREIYAYERGEEVDYQWEKIVELLSPYFRLEEENTNPGIVISPRKFQEKLYWRAVREILDVEDVMPYIEEAGVRAWQFKNGRGVIGASAAIAWRARRKTYELIAYLPEERWNEERWIDEESVKKMDSLFPSTFDNYDYENEYVAIKPNSRTPVLFGIRGVKPEDLILAKDIVEASPYDSWLIFLTNQGSDDHVVRKRIADVREGDNVIIRGRVASHPRRIEGGHVIFSLEDSTGRIDCAAYEPTKGFRRIAEALIPGDEVEVYGSVRWGMRTVNVEKMRIISLAKKMVKVENPVCPVCGKHMESIGKGEGYRCRKCGTRATEEAAKFVEEKRALKEGWYEVPVIARRHIAMPLKLMINFYPRE